MSAEKRHRLETANTGPSSCGVIGIVIPILFAGILCIYSSYTGRIQVMWPEHDLRMVAGLADRTFVLDNCVPRAGGWASGDRGTRGLSRPASAPGPWSGLVRGVVIEEEIS